MVRVSLILFLIFSFSVGSAQDFEDIWVEPSDNGKILSEFLHRQEAVYGLNFICDDKELRPYTITGVTEKRRLRDYLRDHFPNIRIFKHSEGIIFIILRSRAGQYALQKENFLLFRKEGDPATDISGQVVDALTHEPLVGAKVSVPGSILATATDVEGRFNLSFVEEDLVHLEIEYVGYEPNYYIIGISSLGKDEKLSAVLLQESTELQSVTVTAAREDENVTARITGVENLSVAAMKALPAFMGVVDPIRSLTTLPGVNTVGELASGFNVRGGESGQNLVMQDGAIIYNPSHLFGFFSAFNPDMVNHVTLYKGGGPANFGSRISSVLDVSLRNGDAGKHQVSGGLGLISSRLTVEGPIIRNKSSYLLGGRFSYCNWLVRATDNISLKNSGANFRDFTGKIFHTINKNNYLTLTGYHSYDDFKFATDSVFSWGTDNISFIWDHTFDERMYGTLTAAGSNYFSQVHSIGDIEGFEYYNAIRNVTLKYSLTGSAADESTWAAGIESNGTLLEPGKLTPDEGTDNIAAANMQDQRSLETAVFFQWNGNLTEKWLLAAGLRYSYFMRFGKEEIYTFDYARPDGRYPSIMDTLTYDHGELVDHYDGLEPRVSLTYLLDNQASIKASYYRGFQYLHLVSNTSSTTPQDYWISSGPYLAPQRGDQYSLGFFKNLRDNRYELSVEGFYKEIDNAVDYIEGADITLNPALEAGLAQGRGLAYGLEVLVKKSGGRFNGWVAYTFSRSLRRFEKEAPGILINSGKYYASSFDQPHHLALVVNYQLGGRTFLSANFNHSTGRPVTIPVSKFSYDAYLSVLNYSDRNDYRIPDYHRLDLSLTIKDKPRLNRRPTSEWVISIFNVYSRKNTYSVTFNRYGTASKLAVLGSIFPSVNYNFRF